MAVASCHANVFPLEAGGRVDRRPPRTDRANPIGDDAEAGVELYWLPLGAGGHSVRLNGKVFEAVAAWRGRRERCDLYHAGLQVYLPEERFVIEQAPAWGEGSRRGVVAEGPVGLRALGRFRLFRYEIRRWRDGTIPDIAEAVDSPRRLGDDPLQARRLLDLVPQVPTPVWGRDELHAGEMWNSELGDRLAARPQRLRHRLDPAAPRRTRSRLGCWRYRRVS